MNELIPDKFHPRASNSFVKISEIVSIGIQIHCVVSYRPPESNSYDILQNAPKIKGK